MSSLTATSSGCCRRPPSGLALALIYAIAALAPLAVAAASGSGSEGIALELGRGFAYVASAMLFLQFLSSGRYESLSGRVGLDRTMGFHRLSALALLALAVLHPVAYVAPLVVSEPAAAVNRLSAMLAAPRLRSGVLALGGLSLLVAVALLRQQIAVRYEVWRATHGLLATAVAVGLMHHIVRAGGPTLSLLMLWIAFALLALLAYMVVTVLRPLYARRTPWRVESVSKAASGLYEIVVAGPDRAAFAFRGGQFAWFSFGNRSSWLGDHPFSIASGAVALPRLRLLVRESGDFGSCVGAIAPGTPVGVDGPHGSFTLSRASPGPVVMVAGGVGLAPLLSMLEDAAAQGDGRRFLLLYCAQSPSHIAARDRIEALLPKLDLAVTYLVDRGAEGSDLRRGPPTPDLIMKFVAGCRPDQASAYVCGPPPMMELVADSLLAAGLAPARIHYERFDYAAGHGRLDRRRRRQGLAIIAALVLGIVAFALRP